MSAPESQDTRSSQEVVSSEFKRPCLAIVRNHLDSTYMGGLEVELLTTGSGNTTNAPGQLIPVKYLSPFYGLTSYDGANKNDGHQNSQRSYGFWGVPPDIGAKVLVIFIEGGEGYWIGCVPEENTNFMIPDQMAATTFNSQDNTKKLPVVEYNKKTEKGTGRDSTQYIKPVNQDALDVLKQQGLDADDVRGITTSSARREVPSAVFGISSPGPQDKRKGAPQVNYGENFAQTPTPHNRLGGTSIVMDDGDASLVRKTPASEGPPDYISVEKDGIPEPEKGQVTIPHNELFRIRTRTGHQILLHNSEDLIYIGNARGTTWIELTSKGKIDIFAQDSVNIHAGGDMNFKADGSMHFEAGAEIHMKAGASIFQTSAANWEIKVGADGKITAGGSTNIKASKHVVKAQIDMNDGAPAEAAEAKPSQRVPEHEPWSGHENLWDATTTAPADTFKKSVQRSAGSVPATRPPATTPAASKQTYQIKPGDTLSKIAKDRGTTVDAILKANPQITDPNKIQAGATLNLPATTPTSVGTQSGADDGAAAQAAGVTQTPAPASAVPAPVTNAAAAVEQNMSGANVANLATEVRNLGSKLTFPLSQQITKLIDNIAGPGLLKNIASIGGSAIASLQQGASNLLDLRKTVAKGQLPTTIPAGNQDTTNTTAEDRQQLAAVSANPVDGGSITLSDGKRYRTVVTRGVDEEGFSYTQTRLEEIPVDAT